VASVLFVAGTVAVEGWTHWRLLLQEALVFVTVQVALFVFAVERSIPLVLAASNRDARTDFLLVRSNSPVPIFAETDTRQMWSVVGDISELWWMWCASVFLVVAVVVADVVVVLVVVIAAK
jgi:hypothetical protein